MASASGPPKDPEEPVHGRGQREPHESTSSSSAAATSADATVAAAAEGGAVASLTQGREREQPVDGGRGTDGSSPAAAAFNQKGKEKIGEGSSRAPLDFSEEALKNVKISAYPTRPKSLRKEKKKSDFPIKKLLRSSILAFGGYVKKKLSDSKGKQLDGASTSKSPPHVAHKKIPMEEAVYHYLGDIHNVVQKILALPKRESDAIVRLVSLDNYSELRPVSRDGESFYRSFIFSYLEQIVDRVDTREEDRLLAAVRELARRAEHFQWASEFSRRREAFEILIEKIKGWKRMSECPTSSVSYSRGDFLLEFFSSYDTTDDIFAFLRLAAAIWMCSPDHRATFAPGITGLGEGHSLEDWCLTQVIPPRVDADHVAVSALASALQVFVRVETPDHGGCQDSYYINRDTPRVTLVRVDSQYDIIYPLSPGSIHRRPERGGRERWLNCCIGGDLNQLRPARRRQRRRGGGGQQHPDPAAGTSSGGAGQGEGDRAESSSQGAARARARARARWLHSCIGGSKKKQS